MSNQPATAVDAVGSIETRGVDYIPESERASRPRELVWVFVACEFCFGIIVLGQLPIVFGLDWWAAAISTVLGLLLGSVLYAPFALVGTRTGTNSAVSSGAFFGVVGRIFGSVQNLFIGVGFYALAVWTGGQAAIAGLHRLFGVPDGDTALVIAFVAVSVACVLVATYGHANVVLVQRIVLPTMGLLLIIGFIVLAPKFHAHTPGGGHYILGSFWATWLLSLVTAASLPISYAPFVNDYARYISGERWSRRSILLASGGGMFIGCAFALLFATYTSTMMPANVSSWVSGLVALSPGWYVVPIVVVGMIGSFAQGTLCIYGNGLDVSSILPRFRRYRSTAAIGTLGTGLVIAGQFYSSVQSFAASFLIVLVVITTPWMFIVLLGHWLVRGRYHAGDLQVFNRRERGGRYWFSQGLNLAAFSAWVPAMTIGLLFADTSLYIGPFANTFGSGTGGYLCFVFAGGIALILYPALLRLFPRALSHADPHTVPVQTVSSQLSVQPTTLVTEPEAESSS
jgi:purine-cytosine permease-like protein